MTLRRGGGDGAVLVEGVVCQSQEEQSIDVVVDNEPNEKLSGSIRLDVRISDVSNQKMLKGLQELLKYNKSNKVEYSSPVVDVAFGRRKPYLVTNRDRTKLSCASRDAEVQRSVTVPQAHCVINNNLNQKQSEAVDMALAMEDIGIIHGYATLLYLYLLTAAPNKIYL